MPGADGAETERLVQVLRHRHVFAVLREDDLERRELEERVGVSRATSHRYVRTLEDLGLAARQNGVVTLTDLGRDIADAVANFETDVVPRLQLGPLVDVMGEVSPPVDLDAFVDATITSAGAGDPYAPLTRFVSLVQETDTLRGINTCRIAPTYMEEFRERILDGMQTELIDLPEMNRDIMRRYPEKCVQVCVSGNLTLWVHGPQDVLPFGLVLFDERIAVGVYDTATGTLTELIDTDAPTARSWAEDVYDAYKAESAHLENFTMTGLAEVEARL